MKKSPIAIALVSAVSLSFASLTALAQGVPSATSAPPSEGGQVSFDTLDANKDKSLSADEAAMHPELSRQYNVSDSDQDGYISQSEFSAFETRQAAPSGDSGQVSFDSLDTNKDGALNQEEARTHPILSQEYSTVDQNQDGYISQSEFSAFESKPGGAASDTSGQQQRSFEQIDTNKDGWISKQEYEAGTGAKSPPARTTSFQSLDMNKDGFISKNEASADPKITQQFTQIDKDQNGFISQSEFSAFEASQGTPSGAGGTSGSTIR